MSNAEAPYIMFLDNDDFYVDDFCQVMYDKISSNDNVDIVSCRNYYLIGEEYRKYPCILDKKDNILELDTIDGNEDLLTTQSLYVWNKIYKKSLLFKYNIKFPKNGLYEDAYFNMQAFTYAKSLIFLNDYYGYVYNLRTSGEDKSTSQIFSLKNLQKTYNGLTTIYRFLEKENKSFPDIENELLVAFVKLLLITDCDNGIKLEFWDDLKEHYKEYGIFTRINKTSLLFNIFINLGIKFMVLNDSCFNLALKIGNKFKGSLAKSYF